MTRFENDPQAGLGAKRMIEAFNAIGTEEEDLVDAELVQSRLSSLVTRDSIFEFIEGEMARFLQSYGQRRNMKPGIERTRFILNKLTDRPVYYLWKNPNLKLIIDD